MDWIRNVVTHSWAFQKFINRSFVTAPILVKEANSSDDQEFVPVTSMAFEGHAET